MSLNLFSYGESGTSSSSESEDEKPVIEEKKSISPTEASNEVKSANSTPESNIKKEIRSLPSSLSKPKDTIKLPSFNDGVPTIVLHNQAVEKKLSSMVAPNTQQHKKNPHKLIPVQLKRKVQSTEDLSF